MPDKYPYRRDDRIVCRGPFGDEIEIPFRDAKPNDWNMLNEAEQARGLGGAGAKGDRATLADFMATANHSALAFRQWLTLNQCSSRHAIALELEAASAGLDVAAPPPTDVRNQQGPLADPDDPVGQQVQNPVPGLNDTGIDELPEDPAVAWQDDDEGLQAVSDYMPLRDLVRQGVVRKGLSRARFDHRLAKAGQSTRARMACDDAALRAGWFNKELFGQDTPPATPTYSQQWAPVRTRQNYEPTWAPSGSQPDWAPPAATVSTPAQSRYVMNAASGGDDWASRLADLKASVAATEAAVAKLRPPRTAGQAMARRVARFLGVQLDDNEENLYDRP